jgi:hypothetical protein
MVGALFRAGSDDEHLTVFALEDVLNVHQDGCRVEVRLARGGVVTAVTVNYDSVELATTFKNTVCTAWAAWVEGTKLGRP